ncbi:SET and MYND domain-containing protein 4-like isoform X2 [Chelonus insularis]|uniref:SET and MYND domain-containing protein 4-like isoform X2 n=1 Tax=Chelonus insularis TaxID=460826 RepID=UPI00158BAFBA|nr:SET and MYND domain-containing protein 4-like isoform X2 [Chelonus insularis]
MEESDNSYRELCSLETVCSRKKGFFHDFIESVIKDIGKAVIVKIFNKLSEDDDRIRCIFTEPKIKNVVLETLNRVKCLYRDKDALISKAKRQEGFHLASCKDNERALLCFSQAVLRAPIEDSSDKLDKGLDLPLALLGRAEVLMDLGEYEFALDDLESINHHLPADKMIKRKESLEKCHHFISQSKSSLELYKTSNDDEKVKFQNNYRELTLPNLTGDIHTSMPGLSKLVMINDTPSAGKHAVAANNIQIGDIVACEAPLASCLLPEYYGTHCHHCFVRLRAPVGCPKCSSVAFCRRKCRDEAVATYHKYECKIIALLIGSGMSILSMLALRMVTQIGSKACVELRDDLKQSNKIIETAVNTEKKISKSSRRRLRKKKLKEGCVQIDKRAYDLVTLSEKRTPVDFFERSLMAAFLLKCLELVNFFDTSSVVTDALLEEKIAVGSILLRNLQLLQFNAHEIFETQHGNDHRFRGSKTVYLGIAIYPSASRFNHDCYPAVTRCTTERCNGLLVLPQPTNYIIKCSSCKNKVNLNRRLADLKKCEEDYSRGLASVEAEKPLEAMEILINALENFHKVAAPPHRPTHLAEIALASCMASSGNVWKPLMIN